MNRFVILNALALVSFLAPSFSAQSAERNNPLDKILPELGVSLEANRPLDINIDGETFRYMMETLFASSPDLPPSHDPNDNDIQKSQALHQILDTILPQVKRVHIQGNADHLSIRVEMHQKLKTDFIDVKDANWFQLYGLTVPKRFAAQLVYREPRLFLEPQGSAKSFVTLRVRLPVFADKVFLHHVALNPLESQIEAKAGVLWDLIRIKKNFSLVKDRRSRSLPPGAHPVQILGEELKPFLLPFLGGEWEEDTSARELGSESAAESQSEHSEISP